MKRPNFWLLPSETEYFSEEELDTRCFHCGCRFGHHKVQDNSCRNLDLREETIEFWSRTSSFAPEGGYSRAVYIKNLALLKNNSGLL